MDFINIVLRFFQDGGPFMYPIAIALAVGLTIVLERWLFLTNAKMSNRKEFNQLLPLLRQQKFSEVRQQTSASKAPIGRIVGAGVARMARTPRRDEIESAMEEGVLETLPRLEKRTPYLATLANVATLLGLLGTIIGLIAAFTAVANADPTEKATLLSQSISVAMNTTAFGLMAAIPLLLAHSLLQTKTMEIVDSLEMAGVKCLNLMAVDTKTASGSRTGGSRTDDKA